MDTFITVDFDHINHNNLLYEKKLSFEYKNELNYLKQYKLTSFVRIDKEIKDNFHDYLYVFKLACELTGEIGWHPHTKDCNKLWEVYNENSIISSMKSVRIGDAFMSNDVMKTLDQMNFLFDSTALPHSYRNDSHRQYDWSITGNSPYNPCTFDYRCTGSSHYRITEIPMTTIPIAAPYDKIQKRRYVNPTIRKEFFQPAFSHFKNYLTHLVIVLHPDQLITGYQDDLYEYGIDNFKENMDFIYSEIDVNLKTISEYGI